MVEHIDHERTMPEDWVVHPDDHDQSSTAGVLLFPGTTGWLPGQVQTEQNEVAPLGEAFKNAFSGRVICKDCGAVMCITEEQRRKSLWVQAAYYTCSERKDAPCRNVVYEDYLKAIVLIRSKASFSLLPGKGPDKQLARRPK
jgi:hypothetical protein